MLSSKSPYLPDPPLLIDLFRRKRFERIKKREEHGWARQWFLLCGASESRACLQPRPAGLHKILPPPDRIWADPFLWRQGEDFFVFCEEWISGQPHGHIAVMQLSADGSAVSVSAPVLQESFHLSYPFLFEYEGLLHMLPEGGAGGSLDVYICEKFPKRWRKRATLLRNLRYADATLFEHDGKWWLFVTLRRGLFALSRDLFLFSADTPLSNQWKPHPANPIVRGYTGARPAGRLFRIGDRIFRPSQNCLVRYGHSLRINEVLQLDAGSYRERLVSEVTPDWEDGLRAVHHLDWCAGMLAMDSQRLLPLAETLLR